MNALDCRTKEAELPVSVFVELNCYSTLVSPEDHSIKKQGVEPITLYTFTYSLGVNGRVNIHYKCQGYMPLGLVERYIMIEYKANSHHTISLTGLVLAWRSCKNYNLVLY